MWGDKGEGWSKNWNFGLTSFMDGPFRFELEIPILSRMIYCKIFIFFQRKVDLRRHKETQHTDIRTLPQSQTASARPPAVSTAMTPHPPHFLSALHRAHPFLPPPPPLPGLPPLPLPPQHPTTSLAFSMASAPLPSLVHDLSRPRGPTSASLT